MRRCCPAAVLHEPVHVKCVQCCRPAGGGGGESFRESNMMRHMRRRERTSALSSAISGLRDRLSAMTIGATAGVWRGDVNS